MQEVSETSKQKAFLLQFHCEFVDEVLNAIRSALASGMDWNALSLMIKEQKKLKNPLALAIHSLRFDHNSILVFLPNTLPDDTIMDEDELKYQLEEEEKKELLDESELLDGYNDREEQAKRKIEKRKKQKQEKKGDLSSVLKKKSRPLQLVVELDLDLSAFGNAETFFSYKKKSQEKEAKTLAATEQALKKAEKNRKKEFNAIEQVARIKVFRKVLWFEKFHWFISSENYLVIGGKDAQQNEALVKKYLKKNDIYIHAEVHGASSVIIKNPQSASVPPVTLSQAALMAVSRSSAWENKILTSCYWVYSTQVSKSAPSGEFLPTGSFMVRGKRNPIPSAPLIMGLGLLFQLEDACIPAHVGERRIRGNEEVDDLTLSRECSEIKDETVIDDSESEEEDEQVDMQPNVVVTPLIHSKINNEDLQNESSSEDDFGVDVTSNILSKASIANEIDTFNPNVFIPRETNDEKPGHNFKKRYKFFLISI